MLEPMKYMVFWENIHSKCWNLSVRMHNNPPDLIIGLGRGGLVPAIVLSHKMNVPLEPIMWQTRDGEHRNSLALSLLLTKHAHLNTKRILIVDDINDTGTALIDFTKVLEEQIHNNNFDYTYETAVLFERDTSAFKADFVAEALNDERWIIFPWEE